MRKQVKPKRSFLGLVKFIADLFVEPVIFGYLLFISFKRVENLTIGSDGTFWDRLGTDIGKNMGDYWVFIIVFAIWVFYRSYKLREDDDKHNEIIGYLKDISENTKSSKI